LTQSWKHKEHGGDRQHAVSVAKTVDTYRSRLMQKLDLDSFAALVKFAIACALTPP
jgi:FixJ family two-component response regulator